MDDDTTQAAWHQLELDNWQWLLSQDPAYAEWLDKLNQEKANEIRRETIG